MKKIKRSNGKKTIALILCLLGIGSIGAIGVNKLVKTEFKNIVPNKGEILLKDNNKNDLETNNLKNQLEDENKDFTNNIVEGSNWEKEANKLTKEQEENEKQEFEESKENSTQIQNLKQNLTDLEKDNSLSKQEKEKKAKLINEQINSINQRFLERQKEFEEKRKLVQIQEQKLKQAIEEQEAKLKQIKEEQERSEEELKRKHEEELKELEKQKENLFSIEETKEDDKVEDLAKSIRDIDFNNIIEDSNKNLKPEEILVQKRGYDEKSVVVNNDLTIEEQKKLNSTTIKQVKTEWLPLTIYKNNHKYNKYGTWLEVKMRNRI